MGIVRGQQWYVIFCKPHHENQVCHYLDANGFETYFPRCSVQNNNLHPPQIKPLFPRYLFVRADLDATGTSVLNWIPGAIGLVTYGNMPASIPQNIIDELKKRVLEIDARVQSPYHQISHGEHVRIVCGLFSGYEAIFDSDLSGSQRVRVFLHMLDRQVKVSISQNAIETLLTLKD